VKREAANGSAMRRTVQAPEAMNSHAEGVNGFGEAMATPICEKIVIF